ncbi:MAG: glycosyltransferase family 4 protein [Anaerolineales bacterium]|nr:glycosyltransferase family 4 protein [Anaerolineales bacterium]
MKIGVDAVVWHNQRGYGRHARALLSALVKEDSGNQYTFFFDKPVDRPDFPPNVEARYVPSENPAVEAASAEGRRSLRDLSRMSKALSSRGLDCLVFPTVYSYVPVWSRARKVVVLHDVIPELFPALTLPTYSSRIFWWIKSSLARLQADALVTVSDYSKNLIVDHFHVSPERVHVVSEAADPVFQTLSEQQIASLERVQAWITDSPFILYVGGFGPHKNLALLLDMFSHLHKEPAFRDLRLLMVGEYQKESFFSVVKQLQVQIEQSGLEQWVIFTGYLPDEELAGLYNRAQALVLPSLMEGFGLPAVEAAACGCPVIATTASPLSELLGSAGIYIDPYQPEALHAALRQVLGSADLRQAMRQAGLLASAKLTWPAAARQMQSVLLSLEQKRTG